MTTTKRTWVSSNRALGEGLGGTALAVLAIVSFLDSETWYMVLGSCVIALGAAVFGARAIIALRRG
ncbi:hypothetical protein [Arthrobacter sp. HLT1-21]